MSRKDAQFIAKKNASDWFEFGIQYLQTATQIITDYIVAPEKGLKSTHPYVHFDKSERITGLVPAYYMIRHGFELCLKSLEVSVVKEYTRGHDLKHLKQRVNELLRERLRGSLDRSIVQRLLDLTDKFLFFEYLSDFTNGKITGAIDPQNETFRYPEGGSFSISAKFFEGVDTKILNTHRKEIWEFLSIVGELHGGLGVVNSKEHQAKMVAVSE